MCEFSFRMGKKGFSTTVLTAPAVATTLGLPSSTELPWNNHLIGSFVHPDTPIRPLGIRVCAKW
jgi:hypothetical protein